MFTVAHNVLTNSIALLVYEWIITFGDEIDLFWRKKPTVAMCLFLLNRYIPLVYFLTSYPQEYATTNEVRLRPYHNALRLIPFIRGTYRSSSRARWTLIEHSSLRQLQRLDTLVNRSGSATIRTMGT